MQGQRLWGGASSWAALWCLGAPDCKVLLTSCCFPTSLAYCKTQRCELLSLTYSLCQCTPESGMPILSHSRSVSRFKKEHHSGISTCFIALPASRKPLHPLCHQEGKEACLPHTLKALQSRTNQAFRSGRLGRLHTMVDRRYTRRKRGGGVDL